MRIHAIVRTLETWLSGPKETTDTSLQAVERVRKSRKSQYIMETWLSGLKYLTANEAGSKFPRGFESHRLR
jgi:hypothetical protein